MIPVQVQQVGRVRRGDDLNGRTCFPATLWVAEAVECALEVSQQSRVQTAVDLFKTYHRRWVGHVRQRQQGNRDQSTLRQFRGWDLISSLLRPQFDCFVTFLRFVKLD